MRIPTIPVTLPVQGTIAQPRTAAEARAVASARNREAHERRAAADQERGEVKHLLTGMARGPVPPVYAGRREARTSARGRTKATNTLDARAVYAARAQVGDRCGSCGTSVERPLHGLRSDRQGIEAAAAVLAHGQLSAAPDVYRARAAMATGR